MFQNRWTQLRTWLATWSISSIEKNSFMGVFPSPHTAENPKNCLSRPLIHTTVLNNKSLFKDKSALWLTIRLKIARPLCVCGIAHREFMSIFHTLQFDEIFLQIFFASLADFNLLPIIWIFYAILSTGQKITSSWFSAVFINSII